MVLKWGLAVPFAAELLVCTALSALFGWLSMKFVEKPTQGNQQGKFSSEFQPNTKKGRSQVNPVPALWAVEKTDTID